MACRISSTPDVGTSCHSYSPAAAGGAVQERICRQEFSGERAIMERTKRLAIIATLGALTAIVPFSIDMYLSRFSAIVRDLKIDIPQITLSLNSFLLIFQ
jgi:hypothetical protein